MKGKKRYSWNSTVLAGLLLLGMSWVMVACSEDSAYDSQDEDTIQLLSYSKQYHDVGSQLTRAISDEYEHYTTAPILAYMIDATQAQDIAKTTFRYSASSEMWSSAAKIQEGHTYYMYGFSPADAANPIINKVTTSYSDGAYLTLKGVEGVSKKDLCVIVGVKQVNNEHAPVPQDLKPGAFKYIGTVKGNNFAYMLLHHLCAKLCFTMKVDEKYNELRTIKLTRMELKSVPNAYDVNVVLTANSTGADPVSPAWSSSDSKVKNVSFFNDAKGTVLTTTATPATLLPLKIGTDEEELHEIFVSPALSNSMMLVCTYDVYDKKNNLVREGCTAENKLPVSLVRGQMVTVNLTVNPTYLYVLSEPDLDNPTVKIGM